MKESILRNLSNRTRKSYWWHIADYQNYLKKEPEESTIDDLRCYFQHMLSDSKHRPGSVKMGYYALKFLFTQIYHKEWAAEYLPTPKAAKTLPLVLSKDEVFDVLKVIPNFKHRMVIMFIYSTGARVSECVNIRLTDIDSRRMQVNIQEGKGLNSGKFPFLQYCFHCCAGITGNINHSTIFLRGPVVKVPILVFRQYGRFFKKPVLEHRILKDLTLRIPSVIVLLPIFRNREPIC